MAVIGEKVITQGNLDFLRSIDQDNEDALYEGTQALAAVAALLQEIPERLDLITGEQFGCLLRIIQARLSTVRVGIHLSEL